MTAKTSWASSRKLLPAVFLIALPVIIFYATLLRLALNLPFLDDYDVALEFLNRLVQTPGRNAKLLLFLSTQHNEYKLFFAEAIFWLQKSLFGAVDFRVSDFAGNLFVLAIGITLWKVFLPRHEDTARKLALFIPVSYLLFQFNDAASLDWPIGGLQTLAVVAFALAAICAVLQPRLQAFCFALLLLVLSIGASANGFLVLPIGAIVLLQRRQFARLAAWLIAGLACLAAYAWRYTPVPSTGPQHGLLLGLVLHIRPVYVLAFLGDAAFLPSGASFVLATALLLACWFMVRRSYYRRNPAACCCILFILLTALGVSGIRSEIGWQAAVAARYRIYSDLLLIFVWFFLAEEFLQDRRTPLRRNPLYLTVLVSSVLFATLMDVWGVLSMAKRNGKMLRNIATYWHPKTPVQHEVPRQSAAWDAFDAHARATMVQSIRLGIYHPPAD